MLITWFLCVLFCNSFQINHLAILYRGIALTKADDRVWCFFVYSFSYKLVIKFTQVGNLVTLICHQDVKRTGGVSCEYYYANTEVLV